MIEEWKPIEGYEGIYEISSLGNVKSLRTGSIINQWTNHGYKYVTLNNFGKKGFRVHRLVASAFIDNAEDKPTVNHKNGNKTDNRVENLEWATYSENERHSIDVLGKRPVQSFFTDDQIREIRNSGKRPAVLAREYGTSISVMQHIVNRISYARVI